MTDTIPQYTNYNGRRLAYHYHQASPPAFLFCGGFRSDMNGSKALALEEFCINNHYTYMRFDYSGHGKSEGEFSTLTLKDWLADNLHMLNLIKQQHVIIVGSSMGAWLALHTALQQPQRISAFIGIASAPDFTSRLMKARFSNKQLMQLKRTGKVTIRSDYGNYDITNDFLQSGDALLLLDDSIDISCPMYLLHGQQDNDVPYDFSLNIAKQSTASHISTHLIKDGDHRLSRPEDLSLLKHICRFAVDKSLSHLSV